MVNVAATEVLAHDTSLVGSIGVVGGKVSLAGLAERVGVHAEVLAPVRGSKHGTQSCVGPHVDGESIDACAAPNFCKPAKNVRIATTVDKPAMASAAAQPLNVPGRCAGEPSNAIPVYTTAAAVQMTVVHANGSSPRVTRAPTVM